jgi:integrator complex subunit 8
MEIVRIDNSNYVKPQWRINNFWEIPIPLQSVISSIPEGFLKDYSYILLAKSKELALSKDFPGSKTLLNIVENEVQHHAQSLNEANKLLMGGNNLIFKLLKLLSWESLLIEICYYLHAWPATNICKYIYLIEFILC